MIKAIAVDDEPLALDLIETYCSNFDFLQYEKAFTKAGVALQYLEKNPIDLLFLDINMPAMSGMEFYKSLQHKPMLIFTTAYSEYALESYDVGAIDYLLKPYALSRFEKAVQRANEVYNLINNATANEKTKYLMLKADYGVVKITLADILFIEGLDNYLKINLCDNNVVLLRMTLKSLMEKLNKKEFIRVHRSFIIPIGKVETIKHKTVTLSGGEKIPIGKNQEKIISSFCKGGM